MFKSPKSKKTVTTLKSGGNDESQEMKDESTYSVSVDFGVNNLNESDVKLVKDALISRCKFNVDDTINRYPCRFSHDHKKKIYANIIKEQTPKKKMLNIGKNNDKNGIIDPDKICYFTRWKQLNQINNSLGTLNEDVIDDLSNQFSQIFGKKPDIDIESQPVQKDDKSKDDLDNSKEKRKSITIHSYEENAFEYNDNEGGTNKDQNDDEEKKNNDNDKTIAWYLNFAHSNLFIAYRGTLLAQDELQVLEHPFLGSTRECIVNHGKASKENIQFLSRITAYSTPCLFTNVPRQCIIDTMPNSNVKGRERG